jgi:hypothetical protein
MTTGPRSDDDTFDIIDDALLELATRRAAWLGDGFTAIGLVASLIDQAERCLPYFVHEARDNGHSWHEIAQVLGTSPEETRATVRP